MISKTLYSIAGWWDRLMKKANLAPLSRLDFLIIGMILGWVLHFSFVWWIR